MAEGALLNIKLRYGSLLVPYYRLILAGIKALSTVYATGIAPFPTGDVS